MRRASRSCTRCSGSCEGSCALPGSARTGPPSVLAQVSAEHERIVDALERRDAEAALAALVEHLHTSNYALAAKGAHQAEGDDVSAKHFTLREATLLDQAGSFVGPLDVRVEGGRITAVGANLPAGEGASVDFSGLWLLPGVFDCHDHLSLSTVEMTEVLNTPVSQWALETARNARLTLEAGVTFVRDLAGADRGVRDSLAPATCRARRCRSRSC